ncbi:MAG: hypothetical protein RI985_1017, partial [Chloroflexota bacterium]
RGLVGPGMYEDGSRKGVRQGARVYDGPYAAQNTTTPCTILVQG